MGPLRRASSGVVRRPGAGSVPVTSDGLPAGVHHDAARRTVTVGRGPGNTLMIAVLAAVLLLVAAVVTVGVVTNPGLPGALRAVVAAAVAAGLGGGGWLLRSLWTAWWSLGPDGVTIRTGRGRHHRWSEVVALQVVLSGSAATVQVRRRSGRSDRTPTRPLLSTPRRVLRFAVDRGIVPEHVSVEE